MKTLKKFLKKHDACSDGFDFAKDLTLEQFLETCSRGDLMLWLFTKTNPESKQEVILAAGHCANTARYLMNDKRSLQAIDTAIAFGEGRATKSELEAASYAASYVGSYVCPVAVNNVYYAADYPFAVYGAAGTAAAACNAFDNANAYYSAAFAATAIYYDTFFTAAAVYAYYSAAYTDGAVAKKQNQKLTADICRKYLPLEIWNQSEI